MAKGGMNIIIGGFVWREFSQTLAFSLWNFTDIFWVTSQMKLKNGTEHGAI